MSEQNVVNEEEELPRSSAEFAYAQKLTEALLVVLGPRKAAKLLEEMSDMFADEERLSTVLPIRPPSYLAVVRRSRRQAAVMFDAMRPLFLARIRRR